MQQEGAGRLRRKARDAEDLFRSTGIIFNVYGARDAAERLIPFDIVPRVIAGREWDRLSRGIEQRVRAIKAFLHDIYHPQEIIRAKRVLIEAIKRNAAFLPQMIGADPPGGVYTHIVGTDLVRTGEDEFYVLEDNARRPSGMSYMLENRETMLHMFPELFMKTRVRPVSSYPAMLHRSLCACASNSTNGRPVVGVMTPGSYNSAYYEHSFLADKMEVELVEGHDLRVVDAAWPCGPPRAISRSTCSTGVSLTTGSTRSTSIQTARSASRASWMSIAPYGSPWSTRPAPASPMTWRSTPHARDR